MHDKKKKKHGQDTLWDGVEEMDLGIRNGKKQK